MSDIDPNAQVSTEQDGRVLTGIGQPSDALLEHMDRRADAPAGLTEPKTPGGTTPKGTGVETGSPSSAPDAPLTRGRKRFSDLTRERDAARAETAAEKAERAREVTELRQQLQQATTPQQAAQAQQQLTRAEDRQAAQQGQKFAFPRYEEFVAQPGNESVDYDGWLDAKADARDAWRDAQRPSVDAVVGQRLAAERDTRSFLDTHAQSVQRGKAAYRDFETLIASGPGSQVPLGTTAQSALQRAVWVVQHPQSEHLQYAILKDAALAQSLQRMSDIDFGMALARIAPAVQQAQPSHPTPPAPFQPVGSGSQTTNTPSSELAKRGYDFDKSGYREKRAAERGLRRR